VWAQRQVNAYIAEEAIAERHDRGLLPNLTVPDAVGNYRKAVEDGLLKIMSKMGISVLSSYRGGYNFEALGLSRALVVDYFPPMSSRISGLGLSGIQTRVLEMHKRPFLMRLLICQLEDNLNTASQGEAHAFDGQVIHAMQHACNTGSYDSWKKYVSMVSRQGPVNLRDLLDFTPNKPSLSVEKVESITDIRRRPCIPWNQSWCAKSRGA
jgi:glutamate synthase (NADPH/NADH) large chain